MTFHELMLAMSTAQTDTRWRGKYGWKLSLKLIFSPCGCLTKIMSFKCTDKFGFCLKCLFWSHKWLFSPQFNFSNDWEECSVDWRNLTLIELCVNCAPIRQDCLTALNGIQSNSIVLDFTLKLFLFVCLTCSTERQKVSSLVDGVWLVALVG